jgi:hypothetical protein
MGLYNLYAANRQAPWGALAAYIRTQNRGSECDTPRAPDSNHLDPLLSRYQVKFDSTLHL